MRFFVQLALLLAVTVLAYRFGGKDERRVSTIYCLQMAAVILATAIQGQNTDYAQSLPFTRILVDCLGFMAIAAVIADTHKWWVMWVGSAQLLAVIAHGLRIFEVPLAPTVYQVMELWPIWLAISLTGYGTFKQLRRTQKLQDRP